MDPSDGDQEVWSLLDPLSVVCCRLQTLIEARSDGRPTSAGSDVRWQAGLLASVDRATQRLHVLVTSPASTDASRTASDISSSFTVSFNAVNRHLFPRAVYMFIPPLSSFPFPLFYFPFPLLPLPAQSGPYTAMAFGGARPQTLS